MISPQNPSKGRKTLMDWVFGERFESDDPSKQHEGQQSKFEIWAGLIVRLLLVIVTGAMFFEAEDKLPLIGPLFAQVWWAPYAVWIGLAVVLIIADLFSKRGYR
ncbi:hypothetical protein [Brevundimonas sp.]